MLNQVIHFFHPPLSLLGPQSRFGDKLLISRVICPHIWKCGAKRVNAAEAYLTFVSPITCRRVTITHILPLTSVLHDACFVVYDIYHRRSEGVLLIVKIIFALKNVS